MSITSKHPDEGKRLDALHSYQILDTLEEKDFDDLTALASAICNVPIALISLVDEKRQWFKSHRGLPVTETPIEQSFCAHAIVSTDDITIIENARLDDRFKNNPLVTGYPSITFYAGVPLINEDGFPLGTLCVIDSELRNISEQQQSALKILARQVMDKLELKRKILNLNVTNDALAKAQLEMIGVNSQMIESETGLRLALKSADLALWSFNPEKEELSLSDGFREIFGFNAFDQVSFEMLLAKILPDSRHAFKNAILESIIRKEKLFHEFYIAPRKNVEPRWIKCTGQALTVGLPDTNGRYKDSVSFIGVIQDITPAKKFSDQLTEQVRQRTFELERSNEDLLQFAHVASHDLKEPVRKIKTFAGRLKSDPQSKLSEKSSVYLHKIQHATDRMYNMIEGVLSYSEINTNHNFQESVDLNEILASISVDLELSIQQKRAMIKVDRLPVLPGSSLLVYQLFYNIISNSLKFTHRDRDCIISVRASLTDFNNRPFHNIVIQDNGIGFEQQFAEKIFSTFTRLNSKDAFEGTGLGLALCKKIIQRHHGYIRAESELGIGSSFIIQLPFLPTQNK